MYLAINRRKSSVRNLDVLDSFEGRTSGIGLGRHTHIYVWIFIHHMSRSGYVHHINVPAYFTFDGAPQYVEHSHPPGSSHIYSRVSSTPTLLSGLWLQVANKLLVYCRALQYEPLFFTAYTLTFHSHSVVSLNACT